MDFSAVPYLLAFQAECAPEAIALLSTNRMPVGHGRLTEQPAAVITRLNQVGICRKDRAVIVLPNGPEMALVFLPIAGAAMSPPPNPACCASEFDCYLSNEEAGHLTASETRWEEP